MEANDEFGTIRPLHVNGSRHCAKVSKSHKVIHFNGDTLEVLPAEVFE